MTTVDTVVIGAGHAGLAVSRLLTAAGRDHVVLDRGRVGERWRTERWDSLHLLTPSWMTRLPGWSYEGPDPDGYLSAGAFVDHLEAYAASFGAPVEGGTTVEQVRVSGRGGSRYAVATDRGTWQTDNVVVATGPHGTPTIPAGLARDDVLTSSEYRNPDQLPDGGVLVVGASSSGVQIADELNRAGREVVLAVGRHTRMPRRYRGLDIFWWLETTGRLARDIDEMPDPVAARREPSLQLVGSAARNGPRPTSTSGCSRHVECGWPAASRGCPAGSPSSATTSLTTWPPPSRRCTASSARVDAFVERSGLTGEVWPGIWPTPVRLAPPPTRLDLRAEGIGVGGGRRRLPAAPPVAAAADHGRGRRHPSVPRRHGCARRLHRRPALPAPSRLRT